MVDFFKNLSFFIFPLGIGSKRIEFFEKQINKFGGISSKNPNEVSHIIVEGSVSNDKKDLVSVLQTHGIVLRENVRIVKVEWLSRCLKCKALIDEKLYEINQETKRKFECGMSKEEPKKNEDESPEKKQKVDNEKYLCSKPSSSSEKEISEVKKKIVEELEKLANAYATRNDTWRSYSYRKAINAIMLHDKDITTLQEALSIPGIGEKMALKIMEIIESGKLQKVGEIMDEKSKILDSFCRIWGVGPCTAQGWYIQGFRTLEDLKLNAKLTKQQQIGLKLYDDLQQRIPREEVTEIADIVKAEIAKIHKSLFVEIVGSYRRGKATCGDIDIMIINPEVKTSLEILQHVTQSLKSQGYLTDDLVSLEDNGHKKYFGVFKLPGENKTHRRIDLFVVPKTEYASALFHYTGSALFNRSIKLLAAKKQMTLTEHGLYIGTVRRGSEVTSKGQLVLTPTEEDIFRELGLPYRHPEERDH